MRLLHYLLLLRNVTRGVGDEVLLQRCATQLARAQVFWRKAIRYYAKVGEMDLADKDSITSGFWEALHEDYRLIDRLFNVADLT